MRLSSAQAISDSIVLTLQEIQQALVLEKEPASRLECVEMMKNQYALLERIIKLPTED